MKSIGLYFGSFNPIHIGHLIVAEYFATQTNIDQLWFMISPKNPLKSIADMAPESHRLNMVQLAIKENPLLFASDFEFKLPRPSFTCDTLRALAASFPEYRFTILLGEDNKANFHLWKDYLWILDNYTIRFFPRHEIENSSKSIDWLKHDVETVDAPRIEISATAIRENFAHQKSNRYLVPHNVLSYIESNDVYLKRQ